METEFAEERAGFLGLPHHLLFRHLVAGGGSRWETPRGEEPPEALADICEPGWNLDFRGLGSGGASCHIPYLRLSPVLRRGRPPFGFALLLEVRRFFP